MREREREKSKFILEFKKNIKVMVRFKKINTLFHIEMILLSFEMLVSHDNRKIFAIKHIQPLILDTLILSK